MTTITTIGSPIPQSTQTFGARAVEALSRSYHVQLLLACICSLRGIAKAIGHEWAISKATKALRELDDRMLRDIGITRGEIEHRVRGL